MFHDEEHKDEQPNEPEPEYPSQEGREPELTPDQREMLEGVVEVLTEYINEIEEERQK